MIFSGNDKDERDARYEQSHPQQQLPIRRLHLLSSFDCTCKQFCAVIRLFSV